MTALAIVSEWVEKEDLVDVGVPRSFFDVLVAEVLSSGAIVGRLMDADRGDAWVLLHMHDRMVTVWQDRYATHPVISNASVGRVSRRMQPGQAA